VESSDSSYVLETQWVEEVIALSKGSDDKSLFVQIRWPFGHLRAIALPPQVHARVIQVPLQPQSLSGSCDAALELFLPEDHDLIEYQKQVSESGEILLTAMWCIPPFGGINLYVSTNLEFLILANSEAPMQ